MSDRPRVLIVNQYFASREATGQLLVELAEDTVGDVALTVVSARPEQLADPGTAPDPRVRVLTVPAARFGRSSLALRALNYLTFLARLPFAAFRAGRPDVVMCLTDPPVVGLVGLLVARVRRVPFVLGCQDVHPQLGQVSGRLTNPAITGLLRLAQWLLLTRSTRVVALGGAMRERLIELGAPAERVVVIPNWTDADLIRPQPRDTAWARERGLEDRFVVMHAGNIGQLQGLETLLDAAGQTPDVEFVIVGDGSGRAALVERAGREGHANVRFEPWQPRSRMAEVLASADAHLVSLVPGLAGLLEPSKLYAALASGRPVIAALDAASEGARVVREDGCGVVAQPGDAAALANAVRALAEAPAEKREAMGARARAHAEAHGDRAQAAAAYLALWRTLTDGSARSRIGSS